jgi:chromosome segregation ATPase
MKNITTGIDKLVQLIHDKTKISSEQAAKTLGISKDVIEEWIELLEQEKVVSVSYKFSKMYVEERKIDEDTVEISVKQAHSERDAFKRKIEATIKAIDNETSGFEEIRSEFAKVQGRIKDELETVRKEMKELERYDALKKNIDKEIEEQQKTYKQFIQEYDNQLEDFDKAYEQSVEDLKKEEKQLTVFEEKVAELREQKNDVEKTIATSIAQLKEISSALTSQIKNISGTEENIKKIKKDILSITGNIEKNREENIKRLSKLVGSKREQIEEQQDTLLKSAKLKVKEVQNYAEMGKKIYDGFENLFAKKIKTGDLIAEIETEKDNLKKELELLQQKVEVFNVISKHASVVDKLGDIEKTLAAYEKRKETLSGKINNLIGFIKGR